MLETRAGGPDRVSQTAPPLPDCTQIQQPRTRREAMLARGCRDGTPPAETSPSHSARRSICTRSATQSTEPKQVDGRLECSKRLQTTGSWRLRVLGGESLSGPIAMTCPFFARPNLQAQPCPEGADQHSGTQNSRRGCAGRQGPCQLRDQLRSTLNAPGHVRAPRMVLPPGSVMAGKPRD